MTFNGKFVTAALAAALTSGATLPASSSSEPAPAPVPMTPAVERIEAAAPPAPAAPMVAPAPAPVAEPAPAPAAVAPAAPVAEPAPTPAPRRAASAEMDSELECLAKVVLHEAGNQSRTGQIAVAEVVMNRLRSPRFPKTICGVILQRGQFFNVHAYRPYRDPRWQRSIEIARAVRAGETEPVTNGALFFRAHYGAPFCGRTRVATIGGHAFYR